MLGLFVRIWTPACILLKVKHFVGLFVAHAQGGALVIEGRVDTLGRVNVQRVKGVSTHLRYIDLIIPAEKRRIHIVSCSHRMCLRILLHVCYFWLIDVLVGEGLVYDIVAHSNAFVVELLENLAFRVFDFYVEGVIY